MTSEILLLAFLGLCFILDRALLAIILWMVIVMLVNMIKSFVEWNDQRSRSI